MDDAEKDGQKLGITKIRLDSYTPEGLVAQFANTFSFAATENEAFLSFYQPEIPFMNEHVSEEGFQTVKNRCVARVVLTRKGVEALSNLLYQHLERLEKRSGKEEDT